MNVDTMAHYRLIRLVIHPFEASPGFAWSVAFVRVKRGVPEIVHSLQGRVDDPQNTLQWERWERAVALAAEAAY